MTQYSLDLGLDERQPAGVPDLAGAYWLAFTSDTLPEEARARFLAKFGQEAPEVRPGLGGLLLAGPAPREGADHGR